ncbi:hypothetical protein [Streptomyces sp. NPDC005568]
MEAILNHSPTPAAGHPRHADLATQMAHLQTRIDQLVCDQQELLRRVQQEREGR